jgi:hypothetical protein
MVSTTSSSRPLQRRHREPPVRHREGGQQHTNIIVAKLDLPPPKDDNRRVMAVLTYLSPRADREVARPPVAKACQASGCG